jgi:predicted DNA-binding transcriptional regulator AlpA
MDSVSVQDVVLGAELYKLISKTTVHNREKAGKFPKRKYLDPGTWRKPYWLRSEITNWLAQQAKLAEDSQVQAGAIGARLVAARRAKAARHRKAGAR